MQLAGYMQLHEWPEALFFYPANSLPYLVVKDALRCDALRTACNSLVDFTRKSSSKLSLHRLQSITCCGAGWQPLSPRAEIPVFCTRSWVWDGL